MLTLTGAARIGDLSVYRDVVDDGGRPRRTSTVYVLPQTPRFAVHDDGWPAVWLTRYRGAAGDRAAAGAVLTCAIDLRPRAEDLAALAESLGSGVEPQTLSAFAGTVALAVGGSTGPDDLVRSLGGPRRASLTSNQGAAFVVDLDADGATLLDAALQAELPVLHVSYELHFHHAVSGVRIRAWADLRAAYSVLSSRSADTLVDPAVLRTTMSERQLTGLTVETLDAAVDEETVRALQATAQQALDAAVQGSLLGPPDADGRPVLREPQQQRLDLRIDQGMVLQTAVGVTGLLSLQLPPEAGRVRLVETHVPTRLDVDVHCTVRFESSPIDVVQVRWELPSTGAHDVLRFVQGQTEAGFRTPRGSSNTWRYQVEIHFDGWPEPLVMPWVETEQTVVVLDLDDVGVVDVALRLQTLALGEYRAASIELEHPAVPGSATVVLDGEHPVARFTRVTAEHPRRPHRYRVTWLPRDDEGRETGPWQETLDRDIELMPPPRAAPRSEVVVLTVGPFDDLELVICELRPVGQEVGVSLELTRSGMSLTWERDIEVPWEYQQTRVRPDGTRETDPWTPGGDPILVVRDPRAATVTVVPQLLQSWDGWRLAQVQLQPEGSSGGGQLLTFRPGDGERTWRFRSSTTDHLAYRYRQIFVPNDSPRIEGEWTSATSPVLVLRPPPPSP